MQLGRSSPGLTLAVVAVAVIAAVGGAWFARALDRPPQLASGTWLDAPRSIAAFQLSDDQGRPFGNARLLGAPSLLFFGFTHCPDVCPTTLATLAEVLRAAPLPGLRVIFVTVDPARDSPAILHRYLGAFGGDFVGATGPDAALAPLARSLSAAWERVPLPGGDYTMDHSAAVYVIDPQGRFAAVFTPPFAAAPMSRDLAALKSRFAR